MLQSDQERQEDGKKRKDERLVFPKPVQLVMLKV